MTESHLDYIASQKEFQAAGGFKEGDFVEIMRKPDRNELGWDFWNIHMRETIGLVGEITDIHTTGYQVKFSSTSSWCYPYYVLEKIGNM